MESKPIDWIWPDMLAGGKLHLIAGKGGRGKTTLLLNIAATVSKGGRFPCGHAAPQGRVLILSGEDGAEDTILPRLKLAEANSERCEILDPLLGEAFFEVREHLQALEQTIVDRTDVRLLIFDPITAFIGDAENNSPTVVRSVLARLSMMAERPGIAVACISHMRKGKDGEVDERVLGSGAWVHACRIVLGVTETDEHGLILGKLKTNISPREGVFPFELEPIDHPICKTIMRVRWASPLPYKRYEEFKEVAALERGSKIAEAVDFLTRHLSSGPVSYIFLDEKRKDAGITESTLSRASKELGVIKTRQKEIHASTMWVLPDNFQKHSFHVLRSTD